LRALAQAPHLPAGRAQKTATPRRQGARGP
jgi:hypothetical protein